MFSEAEIPTVLRPKDSSRYYLPLVQDLWTNDPRWVSYNSREHSRGWITRLNMSLLFPCKSALPNNLLVPNFKHLKCAS